MAYKVAFQPAAIADLQEGINYYSTISPSLGRKFHTQVKNTISDLAQFAFYELRYDDVRTKKVPLFPYVVHFVFNEQRSVVRILAIRFALRDSGSNRVVREGEAVYSII